MSSTSSQIFPPPPAFLPTSLIDLSQKVYLITESTSGTGLALAKILYNLHATVYIGTRSLSKYTTAASTLKQQCQDSKGDLRPFVADMADLSSIKPAAEAVLKDEWRLDVLFLNADVMTPTSASKTVDGYDLETGVNCLSSFLLATLLLPLMEKTASQFCHPNPSIRVVWASALLNIFTPAGGVQFDPTTNAPKQLKGLENYMQSKAGVYFLAHEFARAAKAPVQQADHTAHTLSNSNPTGVQHVALNPGFTSTSTIPQRSMPAPLRAVFGFVLQGPEYGAYTELYAGLGPDVRSGNFVIPWGRKGSVPAQVLQSTTLQEGQQQAVSSRFYEWCEQQTRRFI